MIEHSWHLVLGLSVLLIWCVVGWWRAKATPLPPARLEKPETSISWAEDVREAIHEDLDGFTERWRGRVPPVR